MCSFIKGMFIGLALGMLSGGAAVVAFDPRLQRKVKKIKPMRAIKELGYLIGDILP